MNQDVNPLESVVGMLGLTRFDLAQIMDATPGIVDAWLTGAMVPGPHSRQRLDDLISLLEMLFDKMTPRAARKWLTEPSVALDFYEPLDLLRRGDLYSVHNVIEALPRAIRLDRILSYDDTLVTSTRLG